MRATNKKYKIELFDKIVDIFAETETVCKNPSFTDKEKRIFNEAVSERDFDLTSKLYDLFNEEIKK